MNKPLARRAGSALVWQGVQLLGGKLIYLARIPILARLLAPDDFGLMAIAIIAVEFLMHVTNFGMIPALVQRERAEDRHYQTAWTVGLVRALTVTVVVFLAAPLVARGFAEPRATEIIRVLSLRPLLQAAASIRLADLTRNLRFRSLAVLSLSEALASTAVSIALAKPFGVWALVAGALAGPTLHTLLSYFVAPSVPRLRLEVETAGTLIRFGRWIFAVGLIALMGRSVLHAAISRKLGADQLGLYFLSAKLAFLPSDVATELVGKVAFPLYARLQSDVEKAAQVFRLLLTGLAAVLLPALGLIIALAPSLVDELLGPNWEGSTPVIRILAAACLLALFNEAATPVFNGLGQPGRVAAIEAVQTVLIIALVWPLTARFGLPGAAFAWIPAIVVAQIVGLISLRRLIRQPFRALGSPLAAIALVSSVGTLLAWVVDHVLPGLVGLILGGGVAMVFIYGSLWMLNQRIDLGLTEAAGQAWPRLGALLSRLSRPSSSVRS